MEEQNISRRGLLGAGLLGAGAFVVATSAQAKTPAKYTGTALDASSFGLKPDSKDNQTAKLMAAIKAAQHTQKPLFIPAGRYVISDLTISAPVTLQGMAGATVLLFAGGQEFIRLEHAEKISFSGLTFDGQTKKFDDGDKRGLVTAQNISGFMIEDCVFQNSHANGLALLECSGYIGRVEARDILQTGIFSLDAQGLEIAQCHVHECGNNGIQIWRSSTGPDNSQVTHNQIENIRADAGGSGQNGNGINVFRAGNVLISENRVKSCAFSAIRSNKADSCQVLGNNCSDLAEVAIYAEFGFEGAIISGNFIERAASGISITNFKEGGRMAVCANNIIRDLFSGKEPEPRGVGIAVEADTVVSCNVVENTPEIGIALGWGRYLRDVVASNNVVRKAKIGFAVSVAKGAGSALITSNLISGSTQSALSGFDHLKRIAPDLIDAEVLKQYSHIQISDNLIT